MNGDIAHSEPEPPSLPRKIKIERSEQGYGFNLHGEKGIHGQYISAIDEGSPAQKNDLRVGDRVIAVNDEDVENLAHSKVVERIRAGGNQVTLLVVDEQCDQYYKSMDQKIPQDRFVIPNIEQPAAEANHVPDDEPRDAVETPEPLAGDNSVEGIAESGAVETPQLQEEEVKESENTDDNDGYEEVIPKTATEPTPLPYQAPTQEPDEVPGVPDTTTSTTTTTTSNGPESPPSDEHSSKLDMAAARPKPKRHEVKRATQNWKQKYDDFNKL